MLQKQHALVRRFVRNGHPTAPLLLLFILLPLVLGPTPVASASNGALTVSATEGDLEDRVEVRWSGAPEGFDYLYRVDRDGALLSFLSAKDTLYVDSTGDPDVVYEYCVLRLDTNKDVVDSVCADGFRRIKAPTSVAASDSTRTDGIEVTWDDNSSVEAGFVIRRKLSGAADLDSIATVAANVGAFVDTVAVVEAGLLFTYCVSAIDEEGFESAQECDDGSRGFVLPPENVQATDGEYADRVVITWTDDVPDEAGFRVYRDGALIADEDDLPELSTEFEDTELGALGTQYDYCVIAVRIDGVETVESVRVCDAGIGGPGTLHTPENVQATDSTLDGEVIVTWDDGGDLEDAYVVSRGTALLDTLPANITEYSDADVDSLTPHAYCVQAITDEGGSSVPVCDIGTRSPVLSPTQLFATTDDFEDRVEVSWTNPSETAVLFRVYRDGAFVKTVSALTGADRFTSPDFDIDTQPHTYCVESFTSVGFKSSQVCTTGARRIRPPEDVAATDDALEDIVRIQWTDASAVEDGYWVLRRVSADSAAVPDTIGTTDPNRVVFADSTASSGIPYEYSVVAFDSLGGVSDVVSDEGQRTLVAPGRVAASDGEFEDRIVISWRDGSRREDGYRIYRRASGDVSDPDSLATLGVDATQYVDSDSLGFAATYEYFVRVFDEQGEFPLTFDETAGSFDEGSTVVLPPTEVNAFDGVASETTPLQLVDPDPFPTGTDLTNAFPGVTLIADVPGAPEPFVAAGGVAELGNDVRGFLADFGDSTVEGTWTEDGPGSPRVFEAVFDDPTAFVSIVMLDPLNSIATEGVLQAYDQQGALLEEVRLPLTDVVLQWWDGATLSISRGAADIASIRAFGTLGDPHPGAVIGALSFSRPFAPDVALAVSWVNPSHVATHFRVLRDGQDLALLPSSTTHLVDESAIPGESYEYCVRAIVTPDSFLGSAADSSETVCDRGGLIEPPVPGSAAELVRQLEPGQAASGFGQACAVSGSRAFVLAGNSAAVYVFDLHSTAAPTRLQLTDEAFGGAVAAQGDWMFAGVVQPNFTNQVDVFRQDLGHGWIREDTLTPSDAESGGMFGAAIAMEGARAVIGAPQTEAAYVFERDELGAWIEVQRLERTVPGDGFGDVVALHGDRIAVGSPWGSTGGRVDVFDRDASGVWTQTASLAHPRSVIGDRYGDALAIRGDVLAVGSPSNENTGLTQHVFLYRNRGEAWSLEQDVSDPDPLDCCNEFGTAVSIDGNRLVIGNPNGELSLGRATILTEIRGRWRRTGLVRSPPGDNVGQAVAMAEGTVVLADRNDGVYVFVLPEVDASDATFDDRVHIEWPDNGTDVDAFRVYRDEVLLATLSGNTYQYDDREAEPGRVYEYCVSGVLSARETGWGCDTGWRPPNGNIAGRVTTPAGAGVGDVSICLDPTPNAGITLDGKGGLLRADDATFPTESLTVELWFRSMDTVNDGTLLEFQQGPTWFRIHDYEDLTIQVGSEFVRTGVALNDGLWHHLAVTWDLAAKLSLIYTDGALADSAGFSAPVAFPPTGVLTIGREVSGEIDEVRIWDHVRPPAEIASERFMRRSGSEPGLVGYWPLDQISAAPATAGLSPTSSNLRLLPGAYWAATGADSIIACAVTDFEGNYSLTDLLYGESTTFQVTPTSEVRRFEPDFKTIVLSQGNPVQNEVDFIETTSYTISGVVNFQGRPGCFPEGVEIFVDDVVRARTNGAGEYELSVDPGFHRIEPRLEGRVFEPEALDLDVLSDLAGVDFHETTLRLLTLEVGGGDCLFPIGDVTLSITSENACFDSTVHVSSSLAIQLPPQRYFVLVQNVENSPLDAGSILAFFQQAGASVVDLTDGDATAQMLYRAPIDIEVSGLPAVTCDTIEIPNRPSVPGVPILAQSDSATVTVRVYEDYGDGLTCNVESGIVIVRDEVIDEEDDPVTLIIEGGYAEVGSGAGRAPYVTIANTPNITSGRQDAAGNDRSYQKSIAFRAEIEGTQPVVHTEWLLVTGHRPRAATFTTSASLEIPILIVRDPPGDGSSAFIENGQKFCTTWTSSVLLKRSDEFGVTVNPGIKFLKGFGLMSETLTKVTFGSGFKIEMQMNAGGQMEVCATATERFSTSSSDAFIGADADVYLGVGTNFIFAKTDVIRLSRNGAVCTVEPAVEAAVGADGFNTIYLYTDDFIENTLIPEQEGFRDEADADGNGPLAEVWDRSIHNWERHREINESLKELAPVLQNRSFSAGADFDFSQSTSLTGSLNWEVSLYAENEISTGLKFEESGVGSEFKYTAKLGIGMKTGGSISAGFTRTVGYTLSDDDPGDRFSVDVKLDPVFAAPVFELVEDASGGGGGTSSCPWEGPPTQPRDQAALTITSGPPAVVPADEAASLVLDVGNVSQSGESRNYVLFVDQLSNPYGAIIRVNGEQLVQGLPLRLPSNGSAPLALTVERGPTRFSYSNLKLVLTPACDFSGIDDGNPLSASTTFSVEFEAPCSDIAIQSPLPGWSHTDGDFLLAGVRVSDFELIAGPDAAVVDSIGVQYRLGGTDQWLPVQPVGAVEPSDIPGGAATYTFQWEVGPGGGSGLDDGSYDLRAITYCQAGNGFSSVVSGRIDRQGPDRIAFEPADGVLAMGEQILIEFNEPIDCENITSDNVTIENVTDGAPVDVDLVCDLDGLLVITPSNPLLSQLEDDSLHVVVQSVPDAAGNTSSTFEWGFVVQRASFTWAQGSILRDVAFDAPGTIAATLTNGRGEDFPFSIQAPSWLTVSPDTGEIRAHEETTIEFSYEFTAPADIDATFQGEVVATLDDGLDTQSILDVTLQVLCQRPALALDPGEFEHTMTLVSELSIGGQPSDDPADIAIAYVGSEVRGVASPDATGLVFLTIFGRIPSGETVRFEIWDDAACRLYPAAKFVPSQSQVLSFVADGRVGSPAAPELLEALDQPGIGAVEIPLAMGWSWFSLNAVTDDMTLPSLLGNLNPGDGDLVKSKDGSYSQFDEGLGWVGTLSELDNISSYLIQLSEPGTILYQGDPVFPSMTPVPVDSGWNWVGYVPQEALDVSAALADLAASDGDLLKSQHQFSEFASGDEWAGSLVTMLPGQGFKLFHDGPATSFLYPPPGAPPTRARPADGLRAVLVSTERGELGGRRDPGERGGGSRGGEREPAVPSAFGGSSSRTAGPWSLNPRMYPYDGTLTAEVRLAEGGRLSSESVVAVLAGDEVRGLGRPMPLPGARGSRVFLMMFAHEAVGREMRFRIWDPASDTTVDVTETVEFRADQVLGTLDQPFVLNVLGGSFGTQVATTFQLGASYPNPVPASRLDVVIPYSLPTAERVGLKLFDVQGRLVKVLLDESMPVGAHQVTVEVRGLASGVYFYRLDAGPYQAVRKMLVVR